VNIHADKKRERERRENEKYEHKQQQRSSPAGSKAQRRLRVGAADPEQFVTGEQQTGPR